MDKVSTKNIVMGGVAVVILVAALLVIHTASRHKPAAVSPQENYVGKQAVLSTPNKTVTFQIDQSVLNMTPTLPNGVQANISLSKFAGSSATGVVNYTKTYPAQQFLSVQTAKGWKVIDHNTGKTLHLPSDAVAKQYNLPQGWYISNKTSHS